MQWLIKLIIEAIGIPPVYIDRGDQVDFDFTLGDLQQGVGWHDLDLSAIVPVGAKGVLMNVEIKNALVDSALKIRKKGNASHNCASWLFTQVANQLITADMTFAVDENRFAEYGLGGMNWLKADFIVKAWWF